LSHGNIDDEVMKLLGVWTTMLPGVTARSSALPMLEGDAAAAVEEVSGALLEVTLAALAAADLPLLQVRLLLALDRHGPLNLGRVAVELGLSAPSASRLVGRAVEAGLILRDVSDRSRREVSLRLSPSGRRTLRVFRQRRRRAISRMTGQMSASERDALLAGLSALNASAERLRT